MFRNSVLIRSVLLRLRFCDDQLAGSGSGDLQPRFHERVVHQVERLQNGAVLLARLVVAIAAQEAVQEVADMVPSDRAR